ncbi:cytidine deaminase [Thermogladius sp. 4427co]|uniref:cytidine deaminase n=1 Tax=Thermogladius sp. 4427co TaxID=3450718 RepID=UPI003F7AD115
MDEELVKRLIEEAARILPNSYAPYSNIHVASTVLTDKGNIYKGVNVENSSYGLTICAERAAIANMVSNGERKPIAVAVVTDMDEPIPPCGACRQVIAEFNDEAVIIMYSIKSGKLVVKNLRELFPSPFKIK